MDLPRRGPRHWLAGFILLLAASPLMAGELVLVIDDLGNSLVYGERAVALPGALTYAILPHAPHTRTLAEKAHAEGKEVILHMPMSNLSRRRLGDGALRSTMTRAQFTSTLAEAIASVPHLSGLNNHMGSELTQMPIAMNWLMEDLSCYHLYFLDSRTTSASVALSAARAHGIDAIDRDLFLDNDRDPAAIAAVFERALRLLPLSERVVVIGHPYPETLTFLEETLPALATRGIAISTASAAIRGTGAVQLAVFEAGVAEEKGRKSAE